jgi:excinuclease ABC subunit A
VLVKTDTFEEAFVKGAGVVATYSDKVAMTSEKCIYHTIRLFSLIDRVVDNIDPASFAFNLYRNACPYCKGYGHFKSYPFHKWIDTNYSVLDPQMTPYKINRVMPKNVIVKFAKEGLFDFSSKVETLTEAEFNVLLYGFKAYKFIKSGKAGKVDDDFLEWRGLNSYIYHNSTKLSQNGNLNQYLDWVACPFCHYGFRPVVEWYRHQGHSIADYLASDQVCRLNIDSGSIADDLPQQKLLNSSQ